MSEPRLGFIGLGTMGAPMARNLLAAGYAVAVFDLDPARVAALAAAGAEPLGSAAEAARACDVVLTSLPTGEIFAQVAATELLRNARRDQVFIELGTTSPPEQRRLAAAFRERGAWLLDAPVSGGVWGAESGRLHVFVGGDENVARRCWPLFEVIGAPDRITWCGPAGAGQVVKGVNQLAMGLTAAALLEAVAFGVRSDVPADLLAAALGGPEPWRQMLERTALRAAEGGEQVEVKFRELPYYLAAAAELEFELPLTQALRAFCERGEPVVVEHGHRVPSFWHELMQDVPAADPAP